jgi:serine/threonine-protein kinase
MEAQPSEKTAPPFGRYVIRERMAEGGMGEVFLAVAVGADGFEKPVVIKRLLPKFAGRADIVSLLAAEAKLMTRLTHPNIVQVIDFGRGDESDYFVVMELISGTNLGKFCQSYTERGERVPIPIALYITNQVLRGLAYAHANASAAGKRLVHRDISPGNILLSTFGEVKVADFGVALVGGGDSSEDDGWIVGKPAYMAPEQLERSAVDERADIYAVGAVLYQVITGSLHRGDIAPGATEIATEITADARAELARVASPELAAIVLRALAPGREGRYAHAREMARAIEQLAETGQKIATADELAEAVSALVQSRPKQTKAVLMLGGDDACFGSGTELRRVEGDDKHGFTLKIRDDAPRAAAAPAAPSAVSIAGGDGDDVALLRPKRRRFVGLALGALGLVVIGLGWLARGSSGAPSATMTQAAAPHGTPATPPPASPATGNPGVSGAAAPPPAERATAEAAPVERPNNAKATAGATKKGEAHTRPKEGAPKEPAAREAATSAPSSTCRGQLHLYATHGWLLSGGPGSVQAPGRYEWPCGTYGLRATSRTDPSEVRTVTVTIREGTPGVVDLR